MFKHKKQLTRHMASKHLIGVQLFSCAICSGIFKRRDSLQKHDRNVHDEGSLAVGKSTYKSHARDASLCVDRVEFTPGNEFGEDLVNLVSI